MRISSGLFEKLLDSPAAWLVVGLLGLLVTLPSLGMGFFLDDYAQLALVESWYPVNAGTFDLYAFLGKLPLDPWWKHPDFKVSMWRPLSSALLQLDNRLFGHNAVGYHVHSILWYLGVLAACGLLFSRVLPRRTALLALLVFALDECHLLTAGWIANRHSMVAMLPALLGVCAHLRWREDGWRPGLPLSILGYAVGLLGGEVALGIMVYAFAYEILVAAGPWSKRLLALLPLAMVGGTYAIGYKLAGFGAAHSGFYLDPVGDPARFLAGTAENIPVLLAAALLGITSDISYFLTGLRPLQVTAGVLALVAFGVLLLFVWREIEEAERRALRWLLPGAALSLLPVAVAQPFDRVLIGPMVGGAVLISVVLVAYARRWRSPDAGKVKRRVAVFVTLAMVLVHIALPTFSRLAGQYVTAVQWKELREAADKIPVEVSAANPVDVVVLNAPDIVFGGFFPLMHAVEGHPPFRSWDVLTLGTRDLVVTRTGPRSLELDVVGGRLLDSAPERFHRPSSSKVLAGAKLHGSVFEVEVLADDGMGPTRLAVRFDREIDEPHLAFLRWGEHGLERCQIPGNGKPLHLPAVPGVIPTALKGLAPAWLW